VVSRRVALVSSYHASWLSHRLLLSSHCTAFLSSCPASWLLHRLSPSSHCATLSLSCRASWLWHCLLPSSRCATLSSNRCTSWLSHCLSPSSRCATLSSTRRVSLLSHCLSSSSCCDPRCPLVLLSRRLVVASPLDAPPSRRLVVSACRLLLSRRASWLSCHHLLSSSHCTALSSSHRAGWLLRCLSLRCPLVLSS
jgi:hypothetical protein